MRFFQKRVIHNFAGDPYLIRYTLFSCRWFGIFLHKILRSDSDRDLHDHPWPFVTLLLWGLYVEDLPADNPPMYGPNGLMYVKPRVCRRGTIIFHKAEDCHCLSLPYTKQFVEAQRKQDKHSVFAHIYSGKPVYVPVWTLFIHGPRTRKWGFHTKDGWVDWETYVAHNRETETSPMED